MAPKNRSRNSRAAASADAYPLVTATTRLTDSATANTGSASRTRWPRKLEKARFNRAMREGIVRIERWRPTRSGCPASILCHTTGTGDALRALPFTGDVDMTAMLLEPPAANAPVATDADLVAAS